ncbi:Golgi apparatus membrane protein TVP18 [Saitoella complicata NRRL Y-17804]|uniref:Golgi apparatus membrane protein TVP18 n=1 Tax=Saitoella complicata (strain BCRC 22490 / CBS 7301 / JCM 7358 / NBRC 10748 / NRRL Y-17804) TaxID=698492 RepID=UPI0008673664|nr:Golgi apparatus membrane protein TVP18 [Saitoella complicata NRRL Y-17804]ODQ49954.1 Golgi apparatus membrane protein TVP18 [Saitoella complicata NRRL Y-17804]
MLARSYFNKLGEEFKTRNFSIYAQWFGLLDIILCFALGISNLFHTTLVIIMSALALLFGFLLIFIEIPFLLRICPLSENFTSFVRRFGDNRMRCVVYLVMAGVEWASLAFQATSLIVVALFLTVTGACYGFAAVKRQEFTSSKMLGGGGVAQMIV